MNINKVYQEISNDGKNVLRPYLMDRYARNEHGQTLLMALTNPSIYTTDSENIILDYLRDVISSPYTDMNAQDKDGNTVLMLLSKHMYGEAYIDSLTKIIRPVDKMMFKRCAKIIAVAIRKGILNKRALDTNIKNNHGDTALMVACRIGDIDTAEALIESLNINVDIKNEDGDTALMILLRSLDKFSIAQESIYPIVSSARTIYSNHRVEQLLSRLYERTNARINNKGQTGLMAILDNADEWIRTKAYKGIWNTLRWSCKRSPSRYFEAQDNDGNGVLFYIFGKKEYTNSFLSSMLIELLNQYNPSNRKAELYKSNKEGFRPVISIFRNPTKDNRDSFDFLKNLRSCGEHCNNYWVDELFDKKTYDECIRLLVGYKDKFEFGSKDFITVTTNGLYLLLMCRMKGDSMEDVIKQIKDAGFDYKFDLQTVYDLDYDFIPLLLSSDLISRGKANQLNDVRQHKIVARIDTILLLLDANLLSESAKQQVLLQCFKEMPKKAIEMGVIEKIKKSGFKYKFDFQTVYDFNFDCIPLLLSSGLMSMEETDQIKMKDMIKKIKDADFDHKFDLQTVYDLDDDFIPLLLSSGLISREKTDQLKYVKHHKIETRMDTLLKLLDANLLSNSAFDQKTYNECINILVGYKDKFEVGSKDFITVTTNCLYLLLMCRMKGDSMEDVIKQIKDAGFDYKFDLQTVYDLDLDYDFIPLLLSSDLISRDKASQLNDVRQHKIVARIDTILMLLDANLLSDNAKQQVLLQCFKEMPKKAIEMDVIEKIKKSGFNYKFDLQTVYDLNYDCIPLLLSGDLISMKEKDHLKDVRHHTIGARMDTLLKLLDANLLSDNAKQQILLKCFKEIPENAIQMIETILQSGTEFPVKLDGVYFPVHDAIRIKLVFRIGESFMKDFFHSKTCQPYFAGLLYSIYKVSGDHFDPVEPCVSLERDYTYQNPRTYRSLNNGGCFQVSCFGFGYDRYDGIRRTDQIAEFMRNIPQNSLNNDLIVSYVGWLLVNYNYEFAEVMLPYMPDTFHYEYNENDVERLLWGVLFDEFGYGPSPLRHYTACERFQIVYSFLSKTDSFCKNFDLKSLDRILDRSDSKNSENWFYKIIHSLDHIKSIDNNPLDGQEQSLDKRERILIEKLSCVLMLINTIDQDGKKPMNELLNCIILKENNMNKLFKLMVCLSLNLDESGVSFRSQQPFEKRQYQALKDFYQQGDKFKIAPWQRTRLSCWEMPFLKLDGSMILKIYDQVREDVKAESKLPKHRESPKIESSHRTTVEFDIKDRVSQQKTDGSGSDKKISPSRGDGIGDADL